MENRVKLFKALGNPTRLRMVQFLANCPSKGCGELSDKFRLSQPTMSHHFQRLIEANVISESKVHTKKIYSLNRAALKKHGLDPAKL